jgi:hypothetical protein
MPLTSVELPARKIDVLTNTLAAAADWLGEFKETQDLIPHSYMKKESIQNLRMALNLPSSKGKRKWSKSRDIASGRPI